MKARLINENFKHTDFGAALLRSRGVEDVEAFLHPTEANLQSWRALVNVQEGVELLYKQEQGARLAIIVDSDVDGFTSATIIGQYLTTWRSDFNIQYFLHSGKAHGLEEHWESLQDEGFDLVIIPDAGSNDSEYAEQLSCPILVIDHHILDKPVTAKNLLVINNQTSPAYLNKNLSGAGMAYQFCRALDERSGLNLAHTYIDLAALGICADMMSGLEIENQYFWHEGFSHINNYFFLSIARKQAYSITGQVAPNDSEIIQSLNPTSVAFYIVPLINAMIRVGTASEKERMLTAFLDGHQMVPCLKRGAKGTMEEAAVESVRECVNARAHQNKIKETASAMLEQKIFKYDLLSNQILFIRLDDDDDFPAELNGLIAMQLCQRYKRPTIVARLNDQGYVRGSIRGPSNSELTSFKDFLESTGLFEYVQGHDNAAGCSIKNEDLAQLHKIANERLAQYDFGDSCYDVNFQRQAGDKDLSDLIENIYSYRNVWSQQNSEPLVYITDLIVTQNDIQIMGRNADTVKIMKNGVSLMKFFAKDMIAELRQYDQLRLEVVGKCNVNTWMGKVSPQIFIENYEIKKDTVLDF